VLTSPEEAHNDFCVMRGVSPPGVAVPLHSHSDTEDFYILSGEVEGLRQVADAYEWISLKAGDYIHVPSNAHHAWRNVSSRPMVALIITTARLARALQEIGRRFTGAPQPATPEELAHFEHFAAMTASYGYWNATPEENAAVGIRF
jgi:quercetin dioxygenase-like cupin family protein